ncbi:MAG TPA: hypothetical protein VGO66_09090 [Solirubrobacterales bacterium]|nr:hypothetical protein [Solirubrobacterales bacterium]
MARLCRQAPKTIPELGSQMGMDDGALRGTVKKMAAWGVLVEAPQSTARRRIYHFSPAWQKDLSEAIRRHRPLDLLGGQRALFVQSPRPADSRLRDVAWVVEFNGGGHSLLAVADDAATSAASIHAGLEREGVSAELLEVSDRWNPSTRGGEPGPG